MLTSDKLVIGSKYNWIGQPARLIYLGKAGSWHQFKEIGDSREIWSEDLSSDLRLLEETDDTKTDWYSGDQKPYRDGLYERYLDSHSLYGFIVLQKFIRNKWYYTYDRTWFESNNQSYSWRGLRRK